MKLTICSAFKAGCIGMLVAFGSPAIAENFAFGVAACPPWKHGEDEAENQRMLDMCPRDLEMMMSALQERFDVTPENTMTLIQDEATPQNLYVQLNALRETLTSEDTLFYYQMSHGGVVPYTYQGYQTSGEIFALYSAEEPANFNTAVQDGLWISARDLRDELYALGEITGANIVVIIEACHSEAAAHDIIHNPFLHLDAENRASFIFSANADQTATFNDDGTGARFTEELVDAIRSAPSGASLDDIFNVARMATHRGVMESCNAMDPEDLRYMYSNPTAYFENCTQEPAYFDPRGLMLDVIAN